MARFLEKYKTEIVPALMERFSYSNVMEVPRLQKISVNMGVGRATENRKALDAAMKDLEIVTGQKPASTRSKGSHAGFKVREGQAIGCRVTLRGLRMYEFLDRLISVVIPRIRDFRGFPEKSFDGRGNYSLGLEEQIVFPEINIDRVEFPQGMDQMNEKMGVIGQVNNLVACGAYVGIGRVLYRQNRLVEAEESLERGIILGTMSGYSGFVRVGLSAMSDIYRSKGDFKTAKELIDRALKIAKTTNTYWVVNTAKVIEARVSLAAGDLAAVKDWGLLKTVPKALYVPTYLRHQAGLVEARFFLAQEAFSKAEELLEKLEKKAKKAGWTEFLMENYVIRAVVARRQDKAEEAEKFLFQAIELAVSSGYMRVILDEVEVLGGVLLQLKEHHPEHDFIQSLYGEFTKAQKEMGKAKEISEKKSEPELVESLTRREQEILELVTAGLSNQEIADQLVIAIGTVGKHTSNIFNKLGAANRTMAVLRAKELEIV